jgi:hypothetical protein
MHRLQAVGTGRQALVDQSLGDGSPTSCEGTVISTRILVFHI